MNFFQRRLSGLDSTNSHTETALKDNRSSRQLQPSNVNHNNKDTSSQISPRTTLNSLTMEAHNNSIHVIPVSPDKNDHDKNTGNTKNPRAFAEREEGEELIEGVAPSEYTESSVETPPIPYDVAYQSKRKGLSTASYSVYNRDYNGVKLVSDGGGGASTHASFSSVSNSSSSSSEESYDSDDSSEEGTDSSSNDGESSVGNCSDQADNGAKRSSTEGNLDTLMMNVEDYPVNNNGEACHKVDMVEGNHHHEKQEQEPQKEDTSMVMNSANQAMYQKDLSNEKPNIITPTSSEGSHDLKHHDSDSRGSHELSSETPMEATNSIPTNNVTQETCLSSIRSCSTSEDDDGSEITSDYESIGDPHTQQPIHTISPIYKDESVETFDARHRKYNQRLLQYMQYPSHPDTSAEEPSPAKSGRGSVTTSVASSATDEEDFFKSLQLERRQYLEQQQHQQERDYLEQRQSKRSLIGESGGGKPSTKMKSQNIALRVPSDDPGANVDNTIMDESAISSSECEKNQAKDTMMDEEKTQEKEPNRDYWRQRSEYWKQKEESVLSHQAQSVDSCQSMESSPPPQEQHDEVDELDIINSFNAETRNVNTQHDDHVANSAPLESTAIHSEPHGSDHSSTPQAETSDILISDNVMALNAMTHGHEDTQANTTNESSAHSDSLVSVTNSDGSESEYTESEHSHDEHTQSSSSFDGSELNYTTDSHQSSRNNNPMMASTPAHAPRAAAAAPEDDSQMIVGFHMTPNPYYTESEAGSSVATPINDPFGWKQDAYHSSRDPVMVIPDFQSSHMLSDQSSEDVTPPYTPPSIFRENTNVDANSNNREITPAAFEAVSHTPSTIPPSASSISRAMSDSTVHTSNRVNDLESTNASTVSHDTLQEDGSRRTIHPEDWETPFPSPCMAKTAPSAEFETDSSAKVKTRKSWFGINTFSKREKAAELESIHNDRRFSTKKDETTDLGGNNNDGSLSGESFAIPRAARSVHEDASVSAYSNQSFDLLVDTPLRSTYPKGSRANKNKIRKPHDAAPPPKYDPEVVFEDVELNSVGDQSSSKRSDTNVRGERFVDTKKAKMIMAMMMVTALALIAGIAGVLLTNNGNGNGGGNGDGNGNINSLGAGGGDRFVPTAPTPTALTSPAPTPLPLSQEEQVRYDGIKNLLLPISGGDVLDDTNSFQYTAFLWVFQTDPMHVDISQASTLIQRYILAVLYYTTGGNNWTLCGAQDTSDPFCYDEKGNIVESSQKKRQQTNFLSLVPECEWFGIRCNGNNVASISLRGNNLVGTLPKELVHLPQLTYLFLDRNSLRGSIPASLFATSPNIVQPKSATVLTPGGGHDIYLSRLKRINLSYNELTGYIPSILGTLTNLQSLALNQNKLDGSIPHELFLPIRTSTTTTKCQLRIIEMSENGNTLTGTIPTEIWSCHHLQKIDFQGNAFRGSLPNGIDMAKLPNLETLLLGRNQLDGTLPMDMFQTGSALKKLGLDNNRFSGKIPKEIGKLLSLETFNVTYNDLTGSMPNDICALKGHKLMDISSDCHPTSSRDAKINCECCTTCAKGYNT